MCENKERVHLIEKKVYLFFKLNSIWSMWPLINDLIYIYTLIN